MTDAVPFAVLQQYDTSTVWHLYMRTCDKCGREVGVAVNVSGDPSDVYVFEAIRGPSGPGQSIEFLTHGCPAARPTEPPEEDAP